MKKLMKLFLSNDKKEQEEFNRELEQILSEVPNKVGNEENFWIYFFLGSILTLPDTMLKESLNIGKIEVKFSSDKKTLNLRVTIDGKVISRSIRSEDKDPVIEYKEDSTLSNENGFIEVSKLLEQDCYLNFGEEATVESSKDLLKDLFENLAKIYNYQKEKDKNTYTSLNLKQKPEALHQAFIYGFMKMNMENSIKCFIEFGAGLGAADLVLKIGNAAVVVECKAGDKTAIDAIEQIKDRGYFCLSILGKCKPIFLVGINFNKQEDKGLKVEEHEMFESQGLINVLIGKSIEEDETEENESEEGILEKKIKKELEFLCYSKNIGRCDPNSSSDNKTAGSFSALVLGQALQYCNKNDDYSCKAERKKMTREEKRLSSSDDDTKDSEFIISDADDNSLLKLKIVESISNDGTISPQNDEDGIYNVKIIITKDDKESIFKICFPRKDSDEIEIIIEKVNQYKPRERRTSERKKVEQGCSDGCIDSGRLVFSSGDNPSSQELSQKPGSSQQNINIEELIKEIKNGKKDCLQKILTKYKDFINSEANLQLFFKGLLMNVEVNGEKIVAEMEVSAGREGKIDLLLKIPDEKGIIFEFKFCDKEGEIKEKKKQAWKQLEQYTDKGNLKYILDEETPYLTSIVFCKGNSECAVKTEDSKTTDDLEVSIDSGIDSLGFSTPRTSLNSTPPPSPGMKRKVLSPCAF